MYAVQSLQFPAVNPPPEISVHETALIGRTKRPHALPRCFFPGNCVLSWFTHLTTGADRSGQPHYVGPGTSSRMLNRICGDNPR